jgi:hypothetical protein
MAGEREPKATSALGENVGHYPAASRMITSLYLSLDPRMAVSVWPSPVLQSSIEGADHG